MKIVQYVSVLGTLRIIGVIYMQCRELEVSRAVFKTSSLGFFALPIARGLGLSVPEWLKISCKVHLREHLKIKKNIISYEPLI